MKFVTDLHLHSKYSRAVSQDMTLPKMAEWAKYKGIDVLATGDFTHPFWFDQLKKELEETGNGLYRLLTTDYGQRTQAADSRQLAVDKQDVYFLLSCEISSIYSQGGKGRRIHNLFFFPSIKSVGKFNRQLLSRGANLRSDGRPIVGISSRDLAKIALEVDSKALIIPAHAWTPWFSIFGSFSGFDSIEECFGDMAKYIYAVETGLSSDPAMNWQVSNLDDRAILSFSDAHSLEKMGREATVFEADEISYEAIYRSIADPEDLSLGKGQEASMVRGLSEESETLNLTSKPNRYPNPNQNTSPKIAFTIEFYPEEGKYHFTGHRDCNVSQSPQETARNGETCPVCGRQLTVGVMHRVDELKTRNSPFDSKLAQGEQFEIRNVNGMRWIHDEHNRRPPYISLVPLMEIIAGALEVAPKTKRVIDQYRLLVDNLGSEFGVLLKANLDEISRFAQPKVVEGIEKVRKGDIRIDPGYDGKFGEVKIWDEEEVGEIDQSQLNLFA